MQGSILRMASSAMWRIGRSIPHIDDGAEDVGNLNTSVHGEGRNLKKAKGHSVTHSKMIVASDTADINAGFIA